MKSVCLLVALLLVKTAIAWNLVGHRVIGRIAYDNLTPQAKRYYNYLNHRLDVFYRPRSLANAASWMDELRFRDIETYTAWHYIDIPFSNDNTSLPSIERVNAVWALTQAVNILKSPKSNDFEKGFSLRVLLHVTGDVHQPLHAVTRISQSLPKGDKGGNLFHLGKNEIADNLHAYWDRGAGLFSAKNKRYTNRAIKQLARTLEKDYPKASFVLGNSDFRRWAAQSHRLAKTNAYQTEEGKKPTKHYRQTVGEKTKQQVALAGYRLAQLLNAIVDAKAY